jgi:hypothetical protein
MPAADPGSRPSRRGVALYPAALLVILVLHVWATSGISPFGALRGVAVTAAIGLGISLACSLVMPDRHLAGVVALVLCLGLAIGGRQPLVTIALLVATGAIFWIGSRRASIDWEWIGRWLRRGTTILALALVLEIVQLGRLADVAFAAGHERARAQPPHGSPRTTDAPDVYVILLDGYPRHDVLDETFDIDDSAFLDGLTDRGFVVSAESHSNYLSTIPSLISLLNYRHLADVPAVASQVGRPNAHLGPAVHRAIVEAAVLDAFRAHGYETVAVASGFEDTELRSADRFLDGGQLNDFELAIVRPTMIAPLALALNPDAFSAYQRARIEWDFAALESLAAEDAGRPRFVFAHLPSPHTPWVVDGDGRPVAATNLETWYFGPDVVGRHPGVDVTALFGGQVRFTGALTLRAIDAILSHSTTPPVILVVSDHGAVLDPADADTERRLRNLFAAYTPGHPDLFPADATLVNAFPTIFEAYLDTPLPRAKETLYLAGGGGLFDPVPVAP